MANAPIKVMILEEGMTLGKVAMDNGLDPRILESNYQAALVEEWNASQ